MFEILNNRLILMLTGKDCSRFLQNIITNDISVNNYCYTYILNSYGRYLLDLFIFKVTDREFFLDLNKNEFLNFINLLEMYKLNFNLKVLELYDSYYVSYSKVELKGDNIVFSIKDPRFNLLGFRSIQKKTKGEQYLEKNSLYIKDKYEYAIPDGNVDLISGKSIPLEYGAEELNAISYTKGCYIGQELMSRIKYQGVIRKKIFKITSEKNLELWRRSVILNNNNISIGSICSSYQTEAIALINTDEIWSSIKFINNNVLEATLPLWYKNTSDRS